MTASEWFISSIWFLSVDKWEYIFHKFLKLYVTIINKWFHLIFKKTARRLKSRMHSNFTAHLRIVKLYHYRFSWIIRNLFPCFSNGNLLFVITLCIINRFLSMFLESMKAINSYRSFREKYISLIKLLPDY